MLQPAAASSEVARRPRVRLGLADAPAPLGHVAPEGSDLPLPPAEALLHWQRLVDPLTASTHVSIIPNWNLLAGAAAVRGASQCLDLSGRGRTGLRCARVRDRFLTCARSRRGLAGNRAAGLCGHSGRDVQSGP